LKNNVDVPEVRTHLQNRVREPSSASRKMAGRKMALKLHPVFIFLPDIFLRPVRVRLSQANTANGRWRVTRNRQEIIAEPRKDPRKTPERPQKDLRKN
jgi:hypothetical protein